MGLIKAAVNSVKGVLADQFLEAVEPFKMGENTVMTSGVLLKRNQKIALNNKGTPDVISDGSVIHVYPNQFMILTDGGKIVDYSAEPGYFTVNNSSSPSMFNGQFSEALNDVFDRIRFSGVSPTSQRVYYINTKEIAGLKFGTRTPINYFDSFYNAELFLRAHGSYSVKITDPLRFYTDVLANDAGHVEFDDISEQFFAEFMSALQAAVNQMSADGIRISHVSSKSFELSKYMSAILDEDWKKLRGVEIQSVGIASISYDDESAKLINLRNRGAMLSDAAIREGYVQATVARGIEAAGSNKAGSMTGFMGINNAMNTGGSFMAAASNTNAAQMKAQNEAKTQNADSWKCSCGNINTGKFCFECGNKKPEPKASWTCSCGNVNTGNFCSECGAKKPSESKCPKCGFSVEGAKFCPECGTKMD